MNQIPDQFADDLPFFQQAIIQHLHNWGLEVRPAKDADMAYALTITTVPSGEGRVPHLEQTHSEAS